MTDGSSIKCGMNDVSSDCIFSAKVIETLELFTFRCVFELRAFDLYVDTINYIALIVSTRLRKRFDINKGSNVFDFIILFDWERDWTRVFDILRLYIIYYTT